MSDPNPLSPSGRRSRSVPLWSASVPEGADEVRRCVLLVQPDPEAGRALACELEHDFTVVPAWNLHEACAAIDVHEERICGVISGALVPSSSGLYQTASELWVRAPEAARILVCEYVPPPELAAAASAVITGDFSADGIAAVTRWVMAAAVPPFDAEPAAC